MEYRRLAIEPVRAPAQPRPGDETRAQRAPPHGDLVEHLVRVAPPDVRAPGTGIGEARGGCPGPGLKGRSDVAHVSANPTAGEQARKEVDEHATIAHGAADPSCVDDPSTRRPSAATSESARARVATSPPPTPTANTIAPLARDVRAPPRVQCAGSPPAIRATPYASAPVPAATRAGRTMTSRTNAPRGSPRKR